MKIKLYLMMWTLLMTAMMTVSISAQRSLPQKDVIRNERSAMTKESEGVTIFDDLLVTDFASKVQRVVLLKSVLDRGLENKYDRNRMSAVISEIDGLLTQIQNSSEKIGRILSKFNTQTGNDVCKTFNIPFCEDNLEKIRKTWGRYNRNNQGGIELSRNINQQASELRLILKDLQKEIESGNPPTAKINWEKVWTAMKCVAGIGIGLYGAGTGNEDISSVGSALIAGNC